ncbi:hypothetical protein [Nonomuraea jiangxiensis]|uniref:DUF1648 domain-containing protein n=1 Tax=Nonomuraea jiangxiensis TaxID=633440 RepID=A0A1G9TJR6_9ACTN|nr:hypothetical protein [Nonomuraea jiangxiensis]SDM47704.1 hypothetical protein SAMN05421869_1455 [Nonomuraea jiangxiensis]
MQQVRVDRDERAVRPPWAGVVVGFLGLTAMIAIARGLWDALPETVTTRVAAEGRPGVEVSRLVFAGALPAVLVAVGVLVAVAVMVEDRLRGRLPGWFVAPRRVRRRAMNVVFVILPLLLVVLQAGLLARTAGHAFPLERAIGVALGGMLVVVGAALPGIVPDGSGGGPAGRFSLAWRRSQRPAGAALMLLGAACAVGVFVLPPMWTVVGAAFLIPVPFVLMALLTAWWMR